MNIFLESSARFVGTQLNLQGHTRHFIPGQTSIAAFCLPFPLPEPAAACSSLTELADGFTLEMKSMIPLLLLIETVTSQLSELTFQS